LKDRIWITAHVRMRSESKLRSLSRRLAFITVWYSTVLTCLTVYQLVAPNEVFRDVAAAAFAVAVLALSIFIPSLNLDQRADRFRECYLKLQRILETTTDDNSLKFAYFDILDAYPNHSTADHTDFIVSSYLNKQEVKYAGVAIPITVPMLASFWCRKVISIALTAVGGLAPGLLYFLL